jgi:hypothetical protein
MGCVMFLDFRNTFFFIFKGNYININHNLVCFWYKEHHCEAGNQNKNILDKKNDANIFI